MDYDELVAKVIELLQRDKRVPYRVLKRRFDLDDDYIEDLKIDLIEAKQLAVDENDRILVWISEAATTPKPAPTQPSQPNIPQETQPAQVESPSVETRTQEAERRQLTVMFCDLVGSTSLSGELDPEDLREVVRSYQAACTEAIQRYEGHVAQLLGDGLLVYFGYPSAHEDDAQRSVHAGLGIIKAIETLNSRLEQDKGSRLAIRIGIHTGLVVVGEMGGVGRQEQLALGETPNIAARIQGFAEPDMVVISAATHQLIEEYFNCETLGEQALRGVAEPIAVYRVLQESGAQSHLDIGNTRGLTPLVGREQEVGLLLERWNQVKDGQGQVVLLSGEGGIGKTRAVQTLKDHVANEPHTRWEYRTSPYFTNSALYPVIDLFQRMLRFQADDTPEQRLEKLEQELSQYRLPLAESVPLFAPLLSLSMSEDRYPPLNWTPQRQRQKTLESIVAILLEQAERQSVLFILEDLHWADPTSLELLDLLIDQIPTASICVLLSCRPTFQPPWSSRSYLTQMTLNRLSRNQIERMAEHVAGGKKLPTEVLQQILVKTDGVPLFVEEMTKAILESGALKDIDGQYELSGPLTSLNIPATLQDSLMARLDRLVTAKAVVQYAAVLGRWFSYELLQAVSQLDEATLQRELSRLVEAELVYQRGLPPQATYTFKHALIQDTAYQSLLRSTRQGYHRRIAEVLTERFPETVETQPELLAHHYSEAGLSEQAVHYWQHAGQRASGRSAHAEAISHLTQGLEVLKTLPDSCTRAQQELGLQNTLGPVLMVIRGWAAPEVEATYARARALCQQVGETPQLFPALMGIGTFYMASGKLQTARELRAQLLSLAQRQQEPALLLHAHLALGATLFWLGELAQARVHLEQGIRLYDQNPSHSPSFVGDDPGVSGRRLVALALWLLGYPDQALRRSHEALTLAQELSHPFSLAFVLSQAALLHHFRREEQATQEQAEAVLALACEQGFARWEAWGTIIGGWALAAQGQREEGIAQIRQGLAAWQVTGQELGRPFLLTMLAEAYGKVGQAEAGLSVIAEALALMDKIGERDYEAELYRLQGELLLAQAGARQQVQEAEACFHQALAVARHQQAKSWELRTAMNLSRLWQQQGKRAEAYALLAPIYGWFTEGFDTADLQDAKALLDDLERSQ